MQWPAGFARFFDYESSSSSSSFFSCSNRVLFITLFPVFTQCLCVLIYLRVQSEASQATPTYVNTPVASPIRGNGAEIMPARLWESARNNRGVAQIRAGRKMRREDGAKERREGRARWGYMQVLSELWGSSRYINSFISAADSAGFLGYGKPRLSFNQRFPREGVVIHGFSEGRVRRVRRGNEPFDRRKYASCFFTGGPRVEIRCRDRAEIRARNIFFPRIPVERSSESDSRRAKNGHGNRRDWM